MGFDEPREIDPGHALRALMAARAEIAATGRVDSELSIIDGLIAGIEENPSSAQEALRQLRALRSGRQDDADQGM